MADRGVSTVVSYVLMLGILVILASTLVGAFAPFVTNQQQRTAHSTLGVIGNDLAGDIESVDRLGKRAGANGTVVVQTRLPTRIGGSPYEIEITQPTAGTTAYAITVRTVEFDASSIVHVRTQTPVEERSEAAALDGGNLRISYDVDANEIVVRHA